jgi:hypothetical protein
MLCTIECNRSLPIDRDPSGEAFVNDLKAWSKLSDDILLWDYVVQFRNYVSPFPNFHVLQPNLQLFEKFGCNMMFQQGSGRSWSDLAEMKAYLIAKLLWDPDTDADVIINDFLYGYYGDAAPFLREYFDTLHEELIQSGANLWIYGYPYDAINTFLTPSLQERYNLLFDQAEEAVKGDPKIIKRVQKARLPIQFAALDISLFNYNDEFSYFTTVDGNLAVKEEKAELLDLFVENCVEAGIERLQEHGTSPEEYREKTGDFILKCLESNLARSKNVGVLSRFSPKYNSRGEKALTDGLRGMNDYHYNWLGFEGEELVAIVDLEEIQTVNHLSADFLQNTGAWIFLPQEVHFYGSIDGIEYTLIGLTENIVPYQFPGPFILSFDTDIPDTRIRYLRIETRSMKTCPDWHIGAGEKSWIFTDEIIVR